MMDRREFLRQATLAAAGVAFVPTFLSACSSDSPSSAPPTTAKAAGPTSTTTVTAAGVSGPLRAGFPYGQLGAPDANGIRLPAGFTSRVVAVSEEPVGDSEYPWHYSPDGGACFAVPDGDGEYVYVSNSETVGANGGGVSAIRFSADGDILDAYRILRDTSLNCAGGPTPWNTWLSGEEHDGGRIWECDPFRASDGKPRAALGVYAHEAAAVDANGKQVYLTEDRPDGRLYRFTPRKYPDLASGRLEVARVDGDPRKGASVQWVQVSDGETGATRPRPAESTAFNGGEGIWWHAGGLYFTTKGDNRVWLLDTAEQQLTVLYDDDTIPDAQLRGVDNVVVSRAGEVVVAEDGDNMQCNLMNADGVIGPLLQVEGQAGSELTGPAFSPPGDRFYFSSQRARGAADPLKGMGVTYEIRGPFNQAG
jgi:secreted PhoX family phosphatase